jgi:hypothetical protein
MSISDEARARALVDEARTRAPDVRSGVEVSATVSITLALLALNETLTETNRILDATARAHAFAAGMELRL